LSALSTLRDKYDEIVFLIADDLQLYNKASVLQGESSLGATIREFNSKNVYFIEKRRWLLKLRQQLPADVRNAVWTFTNISKTTDRTFYAIMRNVSILYELSSEFRRDVDEAAHSYCSRTKIHFSAPQLGLSVHYILEEIAINIRLRLFEGLYAEYYAFDLPKPLLKLYAGNYDVTVFSMAGLSPNNTTYEFYTFRNGRSPTWVIATR